MKIAKIALVTLAGHSLLRAGQFTLDEYKRDQTAIHYLPVLFGIVLLITPVLTVVNLGFGFVEWLYKHTERSTHATT